MMIKFLPHGRGKGYKAAGYLISERDHAMRERKGVKILSGDPEIFSTICESIGNEWKYSSAVIAFAPEDQPTDDQIKEVIEEFEAHAFAGLDSSQYHMFAVLHEEHDSKHIHILTPRIELQSGKALNIAPPNHQSYFDPLRDYFNYKYNWARPDDFLRAKEYQLPNHLEKKYKLSDLKKNEVRDMLSEHIKNYIDLNAIENHDDVLQLLKEIPGVISVTPSKHARTEYISIKFEDRAQAIRLKGALYERNFTAKTYREVRARQKILAQQRAGHRADPSENTAKASAAYQRSRTLRQQREQHHHKIYSAERNAKQYPERNAPSLNTNSRTKNRITSQSAELERVHNRDERDARLYERNDRAVHANSNRYAINASRIQQTKANSLLRDWVYCGHSNLTVNYGSFPSYVANHTDACTAVDHRSEHFGLFAHQTLHGLENEYLRKLTKRTDLSAEPNHSTTRSFDSRIQALHRCIARTKRIVESSEQQTQRELKQLAVTAFTRNNTDAIQRASRSTITRYELDRPTCEAIGSGEHQFKDSLCRATDYVIEANQRYTAFRRNVENTLTSHAGFKQQSNQFNQHCREIGEVVQSIENQTLCFRPRPHNASIPLDCYYSYFEKLVDDQHLNQLIEDFTITSQSFINLITYVQYAEKYAHELKNDVEFCLGRNWANYANEDSFKRQLNVAVQEKEVRHLSHFLEHLNFIQNQKKYFELDSMYSYQLEKMNAEIQKVHPEWKVDQRDKWGLSPFIHLFQKRIPKIQQDLKETIELKQNQFIPRIPEIRVIASQTIERNQAERTKRVVEPERDIKPRPSNDFGLF